MEPNSNPINPTLLHYITLHSIPSTQLEQVNSYTLQTKEVVPYHPIPDPSRSDWPQILRTQFSSLPIRVNFNWRQFWRGATSSLSAHILKPSQVNSVQLHSLPPGLTRFDPLPLHFLSLSPIPSCSIPILCLVVVASRIDFVWCCQLEDDWNCRPQPHPPHPHHHQRKHPYLCQHHIRQMEVQHTRQGWGENCRPKRIDWPLNTTLVVRCQQTEKICRISLFHLPPLLAISHLHSPYPNRPSRVQHHPYRTIIRIFRRFIRSTHKRHRVRMKTNPGLSISIICIH